MGLAFLMPVASSSAESLSSSLSEGGAFVCVGDTDGDGGAGGSDDGAFFLAYLWGGCLAGSWDWCWEPVVSSTVTAAVLAAAAAEAATAAVRASHGGFIGLVLGSPI